MKPKRQKTIWKIILAYFLCSIVFSFDLRLFVYFEWLSEFFYSENNAFFAFLWGVFFTRLGLISLLLVPALQMNTDKPFFIYIVFALLIFCCIVDFVGCIISVPPNYHAYFSEIFDFCIILLAGWSLWSQSSVDQGQSRSS